MIIYLEAEDILAIHSALINETGGSHGVRNIDVVKGISSSPKQIISNQELYPTIHDKAAVYVRETILQHPFVDGNKRTGIASALVFLDDNGYRKRLMEKKEVENFAVEVALKRLPIKQISNWLSKNTRKAV